MIMNATVVIANRISNFIDNWTEGDSYYLTINIDDLFLESYGNLEDEIDEILLNLDVVESFKIKCDELILEINMFVLQHDFIERSTRRKKGKEMENGEYSWQRFYKLQ